MNKISFIIVGLIFLFSCGKNEEPDFNFTRLPDSCTEDDIETIDHFKRDSSYIEHQIISDSLVDVNFRFVEACCQQFDATYKLKNDTLYIAYQQSNEEACACLCCYAYNVKLTGLKSKPKYISISQN